MNIGIIFGGKSFEHDISIISAYQLKKRIIEEYNVHMIYVDFNSNIYVADKLNLNDFKEDKLKKLKKTKFKFKGIEKIKVDVLVSVMHGENGEDGVIAGVCRFYQIPFIGCDCFSGSLCIDKGFSYQFLSENNIKMVDTIIYSYEDYLSGKEIDIFPCIVKPSCLGSSIGINIINSKEEFNFKIIEAFKYDKKLIIQKFFDNILEFNLALNENSFSNLECINKKDSFFSFENKYNDTFKQFHQALINNDRYEEFCSIARNVYRLINASGIIRIDFFILNDEIVVNEVNTTPGALAMYLFKDFNIVFNDCVKEALSKEVKKIERGNFLINSDINK